MPINKTYSKSFPDILKIYDVKRNKNKNVSVNLVKNKENLYNITFNNLSLDDLDFFSKSYKQFTSDELDEMIYHKKMRRSIKDRSKKIQKMYMHGNKKPNLGVGDIVKIDNKILMTKSCNYYKPYHTFTELSTLKEYDYDLGKKEVKVLLSQNIKFDIETFDIQSLKDKYSINNDAKLIEEIEKDFLPEVMNNMQQELSLRDISIQITDKIINECVEKLSNNYENIHNIDQYSKKHNTCLDSIMTQYSDDFEDESEDEDESKNDIIDSKKVEENNKEIVDNYLENNTENIKNVINNTPKIIKHENKNIVQEELYPVIDKLIQDISNNNENCNENENPKLEKDNTLKKNNNEEQEEKGYCVIS